MNEQKATAIIPYNPLSFIHDPTFLPNQPPLSPLRLFLLLLAYLPFSLSIYFCLSMALFLSTFVSRYLGDPATALCPCLRVPRLCTLIYASPFVHLYRACVRVSSTSELEHVYHRYVYLRKMPKQAHKATERHEYE